MTNMVLDRQTHSGKRTVLVVDDHPLMRQGLALLINQQQDMRVCGEAEEGQAALQAVAQLRPDISLNGPDGIEILKTIRTTDPDLPVLVLSMHDEAIYAERALRARANGYIMKQEATEKVLVAVRRILSGEIYLSEKTVKKYVSNILDKLDLKRRSEAAAYITRQSMQR